MSTSNATYPINYTNHTNITYTFDYTDPENNTLYIQILTVLLSFISFFMCGIVYLVYRSEIYGCLYFCCLSRVGLGIVASPFPPPRVRPRLTSIKVKEYIPPLKPPDGVLVINPAKEDYAFGANIHK